MVSPCSASGTARPYAETRRAARRRDLFLDEETPAHADDAVANFIDARLEYGRVVLDVLRDAPRLLDFAGPLPVKDLLQADGLAPVARLLVGRKMTSAGGWRDALHPTLRFEIHPCDVSPVKFEPASVQNRLRALAGDDPPGRHTPAARAHWAEKGWKDDVDMLEAQLRERRVAIATAVCSADGNNTNAHDVIDFLFWTTRPPTEAERCKLVGLYAKLRAACADVCGHRVMVRLPDVRLEATLDGDGSVSVRPLGRYGLPPPCPVSLDGRGVRVPDGPAPWVVAAADEKALLIVVDNLLKWADDPGLPAEVGRRDGSCAFCPGSLEDGPSRQRGVGPSCRRLFSGLLEPIDPPGGVDVPGALVGASSLLSGMQEEGLLAGEGLGAVRRLRGEWASLLGGATTTLDDALRLLARGIELGWERCPVPPELVGPVVRVADFLGVDPTPLLRLVLKLAAFDLRPLVLDRLNAVRADPPPVSARKRKTPCNA